MNLIFSSTIPVFNCFNLQTSSSISEEKLISTVDNGVYVSNLFYNNFVNAPEGLCTGLTRDGLFKIENGEITGSLKNMRWTDSVQNIFSEIELANNATQALHPLYPFISVNPSIKTEKFTFSSKGKH